MKDMSHIRIRDLEQFAIEKYNEGPKLPTIMHEIHKEGYGELHSVVSFVGPFKIGTNPFKRDFFVPRQEARMVEDPMYGLFSIVHVATEKNGPLYALITSVNSRIGFLMPLEFVTIEEKGFWEDSKQSKLLQAALQTAFFLPSSQTQA
jgi:hypothetical protein